MDIAAQNAFRIIQNGFAVIGQNHFHLSAAVGNQLLIILDIVHAGKGMLLIAKQFPEFCFREHVAPGIDAFFVQHVQIDQMVSHLISRVAEHEDNFLCALGNAP